MTVHIVGQDWYTAIGWSRWRRWRAATEKAAEKGVWVAKDETYEHSAGNAIEEYSIIWETWKLLPRDGHLYC